MCSLTQLLAAQSPKRRKILDDSIKLVHELEVLFLCKLPPMVESLRWIPTVAAFILGDSFRKCLALFRETVGKRGFGIDHERRDGVFGDRAGARREREPVGREPGCVGGCSVGGFAVIAG